jgi:hypothetical protein
MKRAMQGALFPGGTALDDMSLSNYDETHPGTS